MGSLGFPELIVILIIVLLIFGPSKLPGLGSSLGKAIREFRQATREGGTLPESDEPEPRGRATARHAEEDNESPRGVGAALSSPSDRGGASVPSTQDGAGPVALNDAAPMK